MYRILSYTIVFDLINALYTYKNMKRGCVKKHNITFLKLGALKDGFLLIFGYFWMIKHIKIATSIHNYIYLFEKFNRNYIYISRNYVHTIIHSPNYLRNHVFL